MKGKRKRMRRAIREAMGDPRPWLEVVEGLQAKGIPLNLILAEANAYGIEKQSSPTASPLRVTRTSAPESTGSPTGRGGVGDSISWHNSFILIPSGSDIRAGTWKEVRVRIVDSSRVSFGWRADISRGLSPNFKQRRTA